MSYKTLALLVALLPRSALAADVDYFTAQTDGRLTIGADGRVLAVELEGEGALGEDVIAGFEERIRAWRFEPVTENGQPVNVVGRMHLRLVAARREGEKSTTFGIRQVTFLDPPGTAGPERHPRMTPPAYPRAALREGVGAEVELLVRVGAGGAADAIAADRVALLSAGGHPARQGNLAMQFTAASERAARSWTFPGHAEGEVLRVPVTYHVGRPGEATGWRLSLPQPVERPAWAVAELARDEALELAANGEAASERLRLLTPLDDTGG